MRVWFLLPLFAGLAGCGVVAANQRAEANAKARADFSAAVEACNQQFTDRTRQAIARAQCINAAQTTHLQPTVPYPDLLLQINATRMATAEQVQAGRMTVAQADLQLAQVVSQVVSEDQRRGLANRAVAAQEAANAPVFCNRVGNTTICN